MENKILLLFFIMIEAVILAFCDTSSFDTFGPRLNEKLDPGHPDLSKRKDFYLFESNDLPPEVKNIAKRPIIFNDRYSEVSDSLNSVEIRQDISKSNFSEKQNEMSELYLDGYNTWQHGKNKPFYLNRQDGYDSSAGQTLTKHVNPQFNNEWDRSGNFFKNSPSQWNEEKNFGQYQTGVDVRNNENYDGTIVGVPNIGKHNVYSDVRNTNAYGKSVLNNREMNGYFQPKNDFLEKKVSLTLLNDQAMRNTNNYDHEAMRNTNNYDHELVQNGYNSLHNPKTNYYFNKNADNFRNSKFHNPDKGVVINFNTECPTSKSVSNPIFHKFIFASKSRIHQPEIPSFQVPETTVITRQMSTPIYYL